MNDNPISKAQAGIARNYLLRLIGKKTMGEDLTISERLVADFLALYYNEN